MGEGAAPLLRVVDREAGAALGVATRAEHLVPFVREIMPQLDAAARTALLQPPPGLLELGQRRMLLEHLRPQLLVGQRRRLLSDHRHLGSWLQTTLVSYFYLLMALLAAAARAAGAWPATLLFKHLRQQLLVGQPSVF